MSTEQPKLDETQPVMGFNGPGKEVLMIKIPIKSMIENGDLFSVMCFVSGLLFQALMEARQAISEHAERKARGGVIVPGGRVPELKVN